MVSDLGGASSQPVLPVAYGGPRKAVGDVVLERAGCRDVMFKGAIIHEQQCYVTVISCSKYVFVLNSSVL